MLIYLVPFVAFFTHSYNFTYSGTEIICLCFTSFITAQRTRCLSNVLGSRIRAQDEKIVYTVLHFLKRCNGRKLLQLKLVAADNFSCIHGVCFYVSSLPVCFIMPWSIHGCKGRQISQIPCASIYRLCISCLVQRSSRKIHYLIVLFN